MSRRATLRPPTVLALAACLGVGAILSGELAQPTPDFRAGTAPATADSSPPIIAPAPKSLAVTALENRPLFVPNRKFAEAAPPVPVPVPVPPAPKPAPPPPPPPDVRSLLTLLGIIDGPDGRIAMVKLKSGGEVRRLVEGDAIERWQLQRIGPDRVTLVMEGVSQELLFPSPTDGRARSGGSRPANPLQRVATQRP
jgi:hypothetical protein